MSQKRPTSVRELDKKDRDKLVKIANDIVKSGLTIRKAVDKYGVPRATLHKRIHNHLPIIDKKLYDKVVAVLGGRNRRAETA